MFRGVPGWLEQWWPYLVGAVAIVLWVVATSHAVLRRRDVRASIGWAGLITFTPILGAILYFVLGVNRLERAAVRVRAGMYRVHRDVEHEVTAEDVATRFPDDDGLTEIARAVGRVTTRPLLTGNAITPLVDGEEAYPSMLSAIGAAERSVSLLTYIFDSDPAGREFIDALAAATKRGVEVRVLIDSAGVRYSRPRAHRLLASAGVRVALFLPLRPWRLRHANLRTHRKSLVVDGKVGFTGGMNIRQHHLVKAGTKEPTHDVHFRIDGPTVGQLQEVFAEDWEFTTKERLAGEEWFPRIEASGGALARAISDGPDEDLDKLPWTLLSALSSARRSVRIMTPYFLPDAPLVGALNAAALRGIRVDVVLPSRNNLAVVQWAMSAHLWQVLGHGVRVWMSPPPFDHSKLLVVDESWTLFGSTNWDPRSLRLHFELNVEAYDRALGERVARLIDERIAQSNQVTRSDLEGRSLPVQIRDGFARLLTPYL